MGSFSHTAESMAAVSVSVSSKFLLFELTDSTIVAAMVASLVDR